MKKYLPLLAAAVLTALPAAAQEEDGGVSLKGSIQSDVLIPQEDQKIGTGTYKDWGLTNTYVDLQLLNKYVSAGARFEYLDHPLPGFEKDFQGWGVPHIYVTGRLKHAELTLGDYYEQFGSGFILRTYEERSLGIDNSLRGARLTLKPVKGVTLKALAGQQRVYWHNRSWDKDFTYLNGTDPWIYGADLELNVDQWFKRMDENGSRLTLGVSAVTKHERSEDIVNLRPTGAKDEFGTDILGAYKLNLPTDVGAIDVRAQFQKGNYSLMAEYALKSQDPSFDNGYIYRRGNALMLSGSYSKRGMSLLLQAKRSEDMAFRSERSRTGTAAFINHLPAFSQQQTYALAALYPYATQNALGEWAFQGEFSYTFKRKTALGGKYGTTVKLNASHIRGIDRQPLMAAGQPVEDLQGTKGYTTKFFRMGHDTYYQDINVQLDKKVTKDFKLNLMYMHQRYNKTIVEGHGGTINSHIAIAEGKYTINKKLTLRGEAQYLHTKQDQATGGTACWNSPCFRISCLPYPTCTMPKCPTPTKRLRASSTSIWCRDATPTVPIASNSPTARPARATTAREASAAMCPPARAFRYLTISTSNLASYANTL